MNAPLHDYQRRAVEWLCEGTGALFADPGLGKTRIALDTMYRTSCEWLVVAPKSVVYNVWRQEAEKWQLEPVYNLHGKLGDADARIHVINPESLHKIDWQRYKGLVIDELTMYRSAGSQRFKWLRPKLDHFEYIYGLTGTPARNSLLQLWPELWIVGCDALEKSMTAFRQKYFYAPNPFGAPHYLEPFPGAEKEIFEAIEPYCYRISAEDHLDLPELVFNDVWVDLSANARTVYDRVDKTGLLRDNQLPWSRLVRAGKLQQIAGGAVYEGHHSNEEDVKKVSGYYFELSTEEKLDALDSLLDELHGQPLLIGYWYDHERIRITDLLRRRKMQYAEAYGGTKPRDLENDIELWNAGKLGVFIAHPQTLGHGVNLQANHHVCFFTLPWSGELYDQFYRRVYRQGQSHRVFVHRLLARGTVDEEIVDALNEGESVEQRLLEAVQ